MICVSKFKASDNSWNSSFWNWEIWTCRGLVVYLIMAYTAKPRNGQDRSLQLILYCGANIQMICRAECPHPAAEKPCWSLKREFVGARPLHLAIARPFCRSNTPQGCLLLAQTRTCRSETPSSCAVRKTVLSLAHPTGVCIVEHHSTNANFQISLCK